MITIEGKYSFESLADYFSNPNNATSISASTCLIFKDSESLLEYTLIPLNAHRSKNALDTKPLHSITFLLQNQEFENLGRFVLLKMKDESFLLILAEDGNPVDSVLRSTASKTLLEFLNNEFGVTTVKHFYDSANILGVDSKVDLDFKYTQIVSAADCAETLSVGDSVALEKILTAGPSISLLELSYVSDATRFGWNDKHSDYISAFEKDFAEFVGVKYAMATSSCTGALHLALLSLGIGEGDEVLVPDITWVATASAVRYVGAKPVFVDINPSTWTLNPELLAGLINKRTKAIIPVHLYGYGALMQSILAVAREHNLKVIEDAAPAIGTKIQGKLAGSFGDFGCFSFQGAKLLVTGEGGMLVTNDEALYAKARKIQDHGRRPGTFWIEELGYKYKMNNITAALGLAQLHRAEHQIALKRQINSWYRDGLSSLGMISFQEEAPETESICWMTSFTIEPTHRVSRDQLIQELKKEGIDSRPVFPSISQYEIWGYQAEIPRISKFVGDSGINLPSGVMLKQASVEKVIKVITSVLI